MDAPHFTDAERDLISQTLAAIGMRDEALPMHHLTNPATGSDRLMALFAPEGAEVCRTIQIASDPEAAADALAHPYHTRRVPKEHRLPVVGYLIDPKAATIRPVLSEDAQPPATPQIAGLRWEPPIVAGPPPPEPAVFADPAHAEAAATALAAFGAPHLEVVAGEAPPPGLALLPPSRRPRPVLAIMGEPGAVERAELFPDMGEAISIVTVASRAGMIPQCGDAPVQSGYLVTLPGLQVSALAGDDDEPFDITDLTG